MTATPETATQVDINRFLLPDSGVSKQAYHEALRAIHTTIVAANDPDFGLPTDILEAQLRPQIEILRQGVGQNLRIVLSLWNIELVNADSQT